MDTERVARLKAWTKEGSQAKLQVDVGKFARIACPATTTTQRNRTTTVAAFSAYKTHNTQSSHTIVASIMSLQDIMNPTEAPPPPPPEEQPKEQKAPMRSWRKKYRKLNFRFQKVMDESNQLWRDEHKAKALARRLQEENDQLLEMLLDMNDDEHLPEHYDLSMSNDPQSLQQYNARILKEGTVAKSLGEMLKRIPHTEDAPSDPSLLPPDLTGDKYPAYLDPAYEEEYLNNLDTQLGDDDAVIIALAERSARPPPSRHVPTDKDLQTSNPNSVISWLRRHHPETFIQDKDNNSERSAAKPRGPGKRPGSTTYKYVSLSSHSRRQANEHRQPTHTTAKDRSRCG